MKSEIICIGTELLVGDILNTNAKYISEKLASIGINLYYQTVVGDNENRLKEVLEIANKRSDLIILTGGLGPTIDDITKETVADFYSEKLIRVDKYYDILKTRYHQMNSDIPKGGNKEVSILQNSELLENTAGIAPGFWYEKSNAITVVLPGPPNEMQPMLDNELMPRLLKYSNDIIKFRTLKIIGVPEGVLDEKLSDFFKMSNPTVAPYAKDGEVHVRIGAKGTDENKIWDEIDNIEKKIRNIYPHNIYTTDDKNFYEIVVEKLKENNMTISTVESITGGMIADKIVSVSGASAVYMGGYITYSNKEKSSLLNIDIEKIEKFGSVSEEICNDMLSGLSNNIKSNVHIAVTGVAGPDKDEKGNEVGTVFIGISINDKISVKRYSFSGSRNRIRERTARTALLEVWENLS